MLEETPFRFISISICVLSYSILFLLWNLGHIKMETGVFHVLKAFPEGWDNIRTYLDPVQNLIEMCLAMVSCEFYHL